VRATHGRQRKCGEGEDGGAGEKPLAHFFGSFAASLMLGFHDFTNSNLNSNDAR
jgi:hypothetical protein